MIVPLGNGGDTRLSVPVPARAVTPSGERPSLFQRRPPGRYPPDAVGKPPSRAIIALRNKERSAWLRRARLLLPLPYLRDRTLRSVLSLRELFLPSLPASKRSYLTITFLHIEIRIKRTTSKTEVLQVKE